MKAKNPSMLSVIPNMLAIKNAAMPIIILSMKHATRRFQNEAFILIRRNYFLNKIRLSQSVLSTVDVHILVVLEFDHLIPSFEMFIGNQLVPERNLFLNDFRIDAAKMQVEFSRISFPLDAGINTLLRVVPRLPNLVL